jgi:hypothetical protein
MIVFRFIGDKGYLGLGENNTAHLSDFWEYTPDSACTTGIEELSTSNFQFTISPNPANQYTVISIQSSGNKKINITVTDVNGKKVYETQTKTSNFKLQTSNFSNGIYFVEVNDGKDKAVKKFLKE